ncbi:MAG: tyrosine--tRNA ligase [Candidatus Pacearchaeota archaeon]
MKKKNLSSEEKLELIKKNTEEILGEEELKKMLEEDEKIRHYIGFEVSGKPHIGHGLVCMSKVKDLQEAGVDISIFIADYHAWINNKLGGDLRIIKEIGVNFIKEVLKAGYKCVGGNPEELKFVVGSEFYHNNDLYWQTVIEISKNTNLSRILRSITIAGREEGEGVEFAMLLYPVMQVADIFSQNLNLVHAGLDQRKAHVIAREVALQLKYCPVLNKKKEKIKPVAIHGPLVLGLGKPPVWPINVERKQEIWSKMKMSKSIPNSAIFMLDDEKTIEKKINEAFCPEGETEFNPIIDWVKHIIFPISKEFLVERPSKFGGNKKYSSFEELKKDFQEKKLHPLDLKKSMSKELIKILKPAREHFSSPQMKKLKEEMDKLLITR